MCTSIVTSSVVASNIATWIAIPACIAIRDSVVATLIIAAAVIRYAAHQTAAVMTTDGAVATVAVA